MIKISKYSYQELCKLIIGKTVNFTSDCQFFPNFNVTGYVININIASNNEFLIHVKRSNGKIIDIGSHMHNLQFKII